MSPCKVCWNTVIGTLFFFLRFIFGCVGSLWLHAGFSLVTVSRGYSVVGVGVLLIEVASLAVEHQL